ncbi:septal ring lytic transglycosylase RlpA family protein [Paradevosia shaoguanensis]|uniref:Endolytic peptidoglycan transglycosylase RlpA n=1 Tax=Paradevosia shaoguanensis TaxID=1335043 RepID=A0AA41QN92_9HYPH|nr:septal ring lytic transglycosylase RlpA family protein [Paradevosia shaoguanensis]MCF1742456.1 septal ring lytic transglycosylase RlpA family protein [Paradevosia shaoguanensis]MCI0126939.1 septal ring lytic transglycosylase RlpA family protein [Paradevosia shaoguanensis]
MSSKRNSWQSMVRLATLLTIVSPVVVACSSGGFHGSTGVKRSAFTSKEFGVSSSPRVSRSANPPRGGGRYLVGKPYTVRGQVYTPKEDPSYVAQGKASWYGADFHGRLTANGEIFSANAISGAHPTLPLPSYVRVTNLDNGRSLVVRVNDRGPYLPGRLMDVSARAADLLGFMNRGSANIQVNYVGPAPLQGDDTRVLLASLNSSTVQEQGNTRLAMVEPQQIRPAVQQVAQAAPAPQPPAAMQGDAVQVVTSFGGHTEVESYQRSKGTYSAKDLAADFMGLFSYADTGMTAQSENDAILNAHDAVNAMATRSPALRDWAATVDQDSRAIKLQIGIFADQTKAIEIEERFAYLGAVEEQAVSAQGRDATRLMLTQLKPGVARDDVLNLARELGLKDIILY